jgi:hypothetical protein
MINTSCTTNQTVTPSVVPTFPTAFAPVVASDFSLNLDLGHHFVCVLDAAGQVVRQSSLVNNRPALLKLLQEFSRRRRGKWRELPF